MGLISAWKRRFGRLTARLAWDLFMVWVALVNLGLIAFDLTYLWLRPYYVHWVPVVARVYDPVKGIEPHPLTEQLRVELEAVQKLVELAPASAELEHRLVDLRRLTERMLVENPFDRAGLGRSFEALRTAIARETGHRSADLASPAVAAVAAAELWPDSAAEVRERLTRLGPAFERALTENYYREFDRAGRLEDHFWLLDLPFLALFWTEFAVRWTLAIRRGAHARWFFFPIFNWYDVLGLLPVGWLRQFRLLRLVAIYMRLRQSELSAVGKDYVTRTVAYISNIITEEVSDRVAIRILDEYAEEIADGTHARIARAVVLPRQRDIARALADQITQLLTDEATLDHFRRLLRLNLETAIAESESLQSVPLPKAVVRPIVRVVGEVLLETTLETVRTTLDTEQGRAAVEGVADAALEQLLTGPWLGQVEALARDISLEVIEQMKATVAVRKWALPKDHPKSQRPASLTDVLDGIADEDPTERPTGGVDERVSRRG